ncbi:hypothetical protein [Streptomyces cellulosae]|uniref:Extensin n=1 Tax=Streptomyces cellulosae TaxID=1968 RepID=A0ABW7Y6I6_STRCE
MADEQYRWLDRETAERLLSGESLEGVGTAARDQAERLAKTLDALTVEPAPISGELPGEAAALAAFRKARVDRVDDWVSDRAGERAASGHRSGDRTADAVLVRIGGPERGGPRPRRGRTVRFGLAAALAVGMVGGVAAGTGLLPTRFGETEPDPTASVSAAATPNGPAVSPSSGTTPRDEPSSDAGTGPGGSHDTADGGSSPTPGATSGSEGRTGRPGRAWPGALPACRDMRDGKGLAAGRRHTLEFAAGGSLYVKKYCKELLAGSSSGNDGKGRTKKNDESNESNENNKDDKGAKDGKADRGGHRGDDGGHKGDRGRHQGKGSGGTGGHGAQSNGNNRSNASDRGSR